MKNNAFEAIIDQSQHILYYQQVGYISIINIDSYDNSSATTLELVDTLLTAFMFVSR